MTIVVKNNEEIYKDRYDSIEEEIKNLGRFVRILAWFMCLILMFILYIVFYSILPEILNVRSIESRVHYLESEYKSFKMESKSIKFNPWFACIMFIAVTAAFGYSYIHKLSYNDSLSLIKSRNIPESSQKKSYSK